LVRSDYAIHDHPVDEIVTVEQAIQYYVEEDRELVEAAVAGPVEHGEPFEFEANFRRRDGASGGLKSWASVFRSKGKQARFGA